MKKSEDLEKIIEYKNLFDGSNKKWTAKNANEAIRKIIDFLLEAEGTNDYSIYFPELEAKIDKEGFIFVECRKWTNHHIWILPTHSDPIFNNQLKNMFNLMINDFTTSELKICSINGIITEYGRKRIKFCAGGANGCDGTALFKTKFNEPLCKNCSENELITKNEEICPIN